MTQRKRQPVTTADAHRQPRRTAQMAREAADPATPPDRLEALSLDLLLEPIVAANPSASAATLTRLANVECSAPRAQHPATRAAVAGNPNTPVEVLLPMAAEFPQEFLANPVLPFALLERPNLGEDLTLEAVRGLVRYEQVPAALLRPLLNQGQLRVQELVRMHVSIAGEPAAGERTVPERALHETLWQAAREAHWTFALPGLFSPWLLDLIADHVYVENIAICPDSSVELLERLAASVSSVIAVRAARNPRTPVAALVRLSTRGNIQINLAITENPRAPEWLLQELAADREPQVRMGVARNRRTPAATLRSLGRDQDASVRVWVARHPRTEARTLGRLARDERAVVRAGVARNRRTPPRRLEALAADVAPVVRAAAARNPELPDHWLKRLLYDDHAVVRRAAARHAPPEPLEALFDGSAEDIALLEGAAANDRLPGALVVHLGQSSSTYILWRVAQHPHAPADLLERLARHPEAAVRAAVARNACTPHSILTYLAEDGERGVRFALAHNPCTPLALLEQLCEVADPPQLYTIVQHPNVSYAARRRLYTRVCHRVEGRNSEQISLVRLAVLASDFLPPERYLDGVWSNQWFERYVLAHNPSAPLDVLESLAHDGIVYVRAAARENLAARAAVKEGT